MAQSPSHKFGQLIGNLLESIMKPVLQEFCLEHGLYLDYQGKKRSARRGKKITWLDHFGNSHDLDYVIERNGTDELIGQPVAFIEVAWRRYTKHSRNKVQEIQGAVRPLAEKYKWNNPFLGAVLAGVFTNGSIEQLTSLGFHVLFFPYEIIVESFAKEGFDIRFDETTPDELFSLSVQLLEQTPETTFDKIKQNLIDTNQKGFHDFLVSLRTRLDRLIEKVVIIPLYGHSNEFPTVESAVMFLESHSIYEGSGAFRKYEILVLFSNGDRLEGSFATKDRAKEFLRFVIN